MNESQQDIQYYEDEIDIKELIILLWKNKKLIVNVMLVCVILTGLISAFVLVPVYNTELNILINMPKAFNTKYGEYTLPITSNEQYLSFITNQEVLSNTIKDMGYNDQEVSVEGLKKRISIENNSNASSTPNIFKIKVSSRTPEESLILAKTLYENYIEFMDLTTKERAVSYYDYNYNVKLKNLDSELKSNEASLKNNELLLVETSQTINQEDAIKDLQETLINHGKYLIIENMINPSYTEIEKSIILNKQNINKIQVQIAEINEYLKELNIEESALKMFQDDGQTKEYKSSITGVVDTHINLSSSPIAPIEKTSPNTTVNIFIGAIIGAMLGVMATVVKEYWFSKK